MPITMQVSKTIGGEICRIFVEDGKFKTEMGGKVAVYPSRDEAMTALLKYKSENKQSLRDANAEMLAEDKERTSELRGVKNAKEESDQARTARLKAEAENSPNRRHQTSKKAKRKRDVPKVRRKSSKAKSKSGDTSKDATEIKV